MGGKSEGEQTLSVSRKEVKYLLSLPDRLYLLDALDRLLTPDAYGGYNGYTVRSVYFDSMTNEDYEDKKIMRMRRKESVSEYITQMIKWQNLN